jgi:MFS family permease
MSSTPPPEPARGESRLGRRDWPVVLTIFWITSLIESLGVSQVFAFLPSYLRELGMPEADRLPFVGLYGSLIFVVGAPFVPLWGVWADKYSRKAVIVRSALVEAVVFACVALSQEPWQLALSLLLIGLQLGNTGVMLAGIRDVVPARRLGTAIAVFGASGPIGFAVGPLLGGFLIDGLGLSISGMFWITAGLSVFTAALVWFLSREVRPEVVPVGRVLDLAYGAIRSVVGDPIVRRIFAIYGVAFLANQMSRPYLPVVVEGLAGTGPGLASSIGFVVGTAALVGADRRADRRGRGPRRGDDRARHRGPRRHVARIRGVQRDGRRHGLRPARNGGSARAPIGDAQPRLPAALRRGDHRTGRRRCRGGHRRRRRTVLARGRGLPRRRRDRLAPCSIARRGGGGTHDRLRPSREYYPSGSGSRASSHPISAEPDGTRRRQMRLTRDLQGPAGQALTRTKWLVLGAALALLASAGPIPAALATVTSGDRSVFVDVTPKRIADTRFDIGITNALASGTPKVLQVTGSVEVAPSGTATVVPTGATGVVLNVTAVNPTRNGFVSVRPGNPGAAPTTSNLNVVAGVTVPNEVTIGLPVGGGNDGDIQVWFQGSGGGATDILVDVVGYYDDHRHDDRYYRMAETRQLVFEHQTMTGAISGASGAAIAPGPYTSARSSTGVYSVGYATTGLGISSGLMPPNISATPNWTCPDGTIAQAGWFGYSSTDGQLTSMSFVIETYTHAGAAVDCSTTFQVNFGGHPELEIAEPGVTGSGGAQSDGAIECRNTETGPVCKPAD